MQYELRPSNQQPTIYVVAVGASHSQEFLKLFLTRATKITFWLVRIPLQPSPRKIYPGKNGRNN